MAADNPRTCTPHLRQVLEVWTEKTVRWKLVGYTDAPAQSPVLYLSDWNAC